RRTRRAPWHSSRALLLLCRQDAGGAEQASHGVRRLGALRHPRLRLLGIYLEVDRLGARVVVPERLDRATVPGAPGIGYHDPVAGCLLRADARESDPNRHELPPRESAVPTASG